MGAAIMRSVYSWSSSIYDLLIKATHYIVLKLSKFLVWKNQTFLQFNLNHPDLCSIGQGNQDKYIIVTVGGSFMAILPELR
jgi:hypothetical protein